MLAMWAIVSPVAAEPPDDPLPPHALARLGSTRLRHGGRVVSLVYLPDGKAVLTAGWDGFIRLWNTADGREMRAWRDPDDDLLLGAAAAPDGRTIFAATRIAVHRWNAAGDRAQPASTSIEVACLAVTPDGRTLVIGGTDGRITLLDPATGKTIRQWRAHKARLGGLAVTPDGKRLLSGGADQSVRMWDMETAAELRSRDWPGPVGTATFSKDGRIAALTTGDWIAGERRRAVQLIRSDTLADDRRLDGPPLGVCCTAFAPDGATVVGGGFDGSIQQWDVATGKPRRRLEKHAGEVLALAFAPDGKTIASAGADSTVRLWDVQAGAERHAGIGHRARVEAVAADPLGRMVATAGQDGSVRFWDLPGGRPRRPPVRLTNQGLLATEFAAAGNLAVAGDQVYVIDPATGEDRRPFGPFGPSLSYKASFSAGGRFVAAIGRTFGRQYGVGVFDIPTLKVVRWLDDSPDLLTSVAVSSDGRVVAAGELRLQANAGGDILVWDAAAGGKPRRWEADTGSVSVALTPDGRLLASSGRGAATVLWDPSTGRRLADLLGGGGEVSSLSFSRDGRCLAAGTTAGTVSVWEVASRGVRQTFHGHVGTVQTAAFTVDGRVLVTGGDDTTAVVWDLTGGNAARTAAAEFEHLWADLAAEPPVAATAVWRLAAGGTPMVAQVANRVALAAPLDGDQVARWLAALDSPRFADRNAAAGRLADVAEQAEPALRKALAGSISAEQRRQIDSLLKQLEGPPAPAVLRQIRTVEALERSGTPEARKVLERLAGGADSRLTREAKCALDRLPTNKR
jgi:WD40 repeat protein